MFELTTQERRAILFLICLGLIGLGLNYAAKLNAPVLSFFEPEGASHKLNINRAGCQELSGLKGLTPSLAKKVIEYRQENGPFGAIEELKKVKGIGERRLEKLKDYLTLE